METAGCIIPRKRCVVGMRRDSPVSLRFGSPCREAKALRALCHCEPACRRPPIRHCEPLRPQACTERNRRRRLLARVVPQIPSTSLRGSVHTAVAIFPRSTEAAGTEENSYTSDARHCLKMTERGGAGKTEKYKYFPKNLLTFQSNDDKITQPH